MKHDTIFDAELYAEYVNTPENERIALDNVCDVILEALDYKQCDAHRDLIREHVERIVSVLFGERYDRDDFLVDWADLYSFEAWQRGEHRQW